MKKILTLGLILSFYTFQLFAQDYNIYLMGKKLFYENKYENIDSVIVKNLNKGTQINLSNNDALVLKYANPQNTKTTNKLTLEAYPNPFSEFSTIEFNSPNKSQAEIAIYNLNGQLLQKSVFNLGQAIYTVRVSGLYYGAYTFIIRSENYFYSGKLFSTSQNKNEPKIEIINQKSISSLFSPSKLSNNLKNDVELTYTQGDIILFHAYSKDNQSIKTIEMKVPNHNVDTTISINFTQCIDANNNNYPIVQFGESSFVWTAKDLKTTKYLNGEDIPNVKTKLTWATLSEGAVCSYNDSISSLNLYNWYAVTDARGLCPTGWHVPTENEWSELESKIGISPIVFSEYGWRGSNEGAKLKSTEGNIWNATSNKSTNTTGFSAIPTGMRNFLGHYYYKDNYSVWWATDSSTESSAWCRALSSSNEQIFREDASKTSGLAVRCIKNQPFIPIVETVSVSEPTNSTPYCTSRIINDGGAEILQYGVIWGNNANITLETNTDYTEEHYGHFEENNTEYIQYLRNLNNGELVYVRAYARNVAGIGYGNAISFTSSGFKCGNTVSFIYKGETVNYETVEVGSDCWFAKNLGAERIATTIEDDLSFGDLFQWGREADGHQIRNSELTDILSAANQQPGHNKFISQSNSTDWNSNNEWTERWYTNTGEALAANPCPSGWHVSSINDWNSAINTFNWQTGTDLFNSNLKIPIAGIRDEFSPVGRGEISIIWTSDVYNNKLKNTETTDTEVIYISHEHNAIQLNTTTNNEKWLGKGIVDENKGIFDPKVAGLGTHTISCHQSNSIENTKFEITIIVK